MTRFPAVSNTRTVRTAGRATDHRLIYRPPHVLVLSSTWWCGTVGTLFSTDDVTVIHIEIQKFAEHQKKKTGKVVLGMYYSTCSIIGTYVEERSREGRGASRRECYAQHVLFYVLSMPEATHKTGTQTTRQDSSLSLRNRERERERESGREQRMPRDSRHQ